MFRALSSARIAHATCTVAAVALAAFAALVALHSWQRMRSLEAALLRALANGSASLASIAGDNAALLRCSSGSSVSPRLFRLTDCGFSSPVQAPSRPF
jgi:hypothetical protein